MGNTEEALTLNASRLFPRFHAKAIYLAQTRKHCCGSKIVSRTQNVFGKFQKYILLSRHRFCVLSIYYVGAQRRKHLGNTEEALTLNASRLFPRLHAKAIHLEDLKFASRK